MDHLQTRRICIRCVCSVPHSDRVTGP
jgi:hypothetical protein